MRSIWKVLTGLLALSLVLAAVVWTVPAGTIAGVNSAAENSASRSVARTANGGAQQDSGDPEQALLEVYASEPSVPTVSPAVRDLPEIEVDPLLQREMARRDNRGFVGEGVQGPAWLDPLVQIQRNTPLAAPDAFTTPLTNWAGMDYNSYPPDATVDVGPNHVVQAVNGSGGSTVQVFNKSGAVLKTFTMDSLSTSAPCNNGYCDPIVIYDWQADRWLITEFSASSGNAYCLYVSTTPDPTGTWYAYTFDLPYFDYPKYGVWRDAYYMGYNGGPSGYVQVFAFDRAKMLAGQAATYQMFNVPELTGFSFQLLVPASWDSPAAPPTGLGGLFMRPLDTEVNGPAGFPSTDFLEIYEFDVDWVTPANSTLTTLPDVPISEYDATLCGTGSDWSCMEQPGTTQALDPIREPIHQPLQYRNWGAYETLVGGFAEDVDGADTAAVRWFELRRVDGAWSTYQEGVVGGGDDHHRSVTSVAMDRGGSIALGYTLTSSTVYPSIRYAGRRAWDPLGTMPYVDIVAQEGTGSQTGIERWGDYSGIGVDPADDCTFWYTTEYMLGSSSATRVISFRHDADFSPDASPNALTVCQPANAVYTVQAAATCAFSGAVTMSVSGLPGGVTASWSANPVAPPGSTTLTIANTGAAAVGSYNVTITGASGLISRSETVLLNVSSGEPLGAVSLVTPADGTAGISMTPTLTWQALAGASSYDIEVATDLAFTNIVRSATGLTTTSYSPSPALNEGAVYYWRVSANNACGAGAVSTTWAFRTAAISCTTYTSTDVPKLVPPSGTSGTTTSTVTVPDSGAIADVNVTIGRLTHTYDADLDIYISHPDATLVELSTDNGGSGDNYISTVFDDEATNAIAAGSAPFTGSFKPEGSLAALDGKASGGAWKLTVTDDATTNSGTLTSWGVTICSTAPLATDYSDLAYSYGIAWHTGNGVLKLGSLWTAEATFTAGHDDPTAGDGSDDGVAPALNAWWGGGRGAFDVTASGDGCLNGWMDFGNGTGVGPAYADGDFGDSYGGVSEQIITMQSVSAGTANITFAVPSGILGAGANTYAFRFRLTPRKTGAACADVGSIAGGATAGEVEDYRLTFAPLAVTLAGFTAEATAEGVTLAWETISETDNAGFNVYRAAGGAAGDRPLQGWAKVNDALIPAATPGSSQGNVYSWTDAAATTGTYWYLLEDVALNGAAAQHEPVSVTLVEPNAVGLAAFGAAAAPTAAAPAVAAPSFPALVAAALAAITALGRAALRRRR